MILKKNLFLNKMNAIYAILVMNKYYGLYIYDYRHFDIVSFVRSHRTEQMIQYQNEDNHIYIDHNIYHNVALRCKFKYSSCSIHNISRSIRDRDRCRDVEASIASVVPILIMIVIVVEMHHQHPVRSPATRLKLTTAASTRNPASSLMSTDPPVFLLYIHLKSVFTTLTRELSLPQL